MTNLITFKLHEQKHSPQSQPRPPLQKTTSAWCQFTWKRSNTISLHPPSASTHHQPPPSCSLHPPAARDTHSSHWDDSAQSNTNTFLYKGDVMMMMMIMHRTCNEDDRQQMHSMFQHLRPLTQRELKL